MGETITEVEGPEIVASDEDISLKSPSRPWIRRTINIVAIVVAGVVVIWFAGSLLLMWKPWERWVSFGEHFATSPAMAGIAAVVAATIGATALKKQLDHSKSQSAEASWWEKFEWVTDRILPKDPKQEKLAKPLAVALLTSLLKMATVDFQRGAVSGVIDHYFGPDNDEGLQKQGQSVRDFDAELRALRSLVDASKNTAASSGATGALRASMYEQSVFEALRQMWELGNELQFQPRVSEGERGIFVPDAVLTVNGRRAILEFKAWSKFTPVGADRVLDMVSRVVPILDADEIILITSAEVPLEFAPGGRNAARYHGMKLIHWLPEEGIAALESRLRSALA